MSVTATKASSCAAGIWLAVTLFSRPGATDIIRASIPFNTCAASIRRARPDLMSRFAKIAFLLFFFALCGTAIVITHLRQQRIPPPAAKELYSIVNRQLSALRADDF